MPKASFIKSAMYGHWLTIKLFFDLIESVYIFFLTCIRTLVNTWMFKGYFYLLWWNEINLQSRTKLLEKVFHIMSTFLRNKTISKTTPLWKENPFSQFNVASHKRPGIRLSFEYTTLLSGEGGEGRAGTATMFRKMLSKRTIFSTVLSKIVALQTLVINALCITYI